MCNCAQTPLRTKDINALSDGFPWAVGEVLPNLESIMSLEVALAIGMDSSLLEIQSSPWRSSEYDFMFASSIKDAIVHFINSPHFSTLPMATRRFLPHCRATQTLPLAPYFG
jgi:hypothetical protein